MRRPLPLAITVGGIAALALHHVFLTLYIDNGVVVRDYWRFVHLIDDFHRGQLTLEEMLAATNGPFRSIFVPAVILLDGVVFGLPLITIHVAALLLSACSAGVVLAFVRRHLPLGGPSVLVLLCLGLVLLTPMHLYLIAYGQASFSIIRVAIYLPVMVFTVHVLTGKTVPSTFARWVAVFAFTVIVVGSGYMPALVATVGLLSGAALLQAGATSPFSDGQWRRPVGVLLVALAAFAVAWLLLFDSADFSREAERVLRGSPLDRPARFGRFFLGVMATSLLGERAPGISTDGLVLLGAIATLAAIATVAKGLVSFRRTGPVALLAAGLASYSLLVAASISLVRTVSGTGVARRYLADTTLWQAGCLLVITLALVSRTQGASEGRRRSTVRVAGALSVIGILVLAHAAALYTQWGNASRFKGRTERIKDAIRTSERYSDRELKRLLSANDRQFQFVEEGIATMKRYRLNVFREGEPPR